ncbi:unnamed protein product [Somion occarium]|uniref:Rho GTPase-activating protein 39 n=1 Tax=Somion occarium TaxID=3059160 RepID=A0ABP1DKF2_9APHY
MAAASASPSAQDDLSSTSQGAASPQISFGDSSDIPPAPEVQVNGRPAPSSSASPSKSSSPNSSQGEDGWGSHFWVTLVDPQSGVSFYACPATGEVSWDPPVGNFLLPPSPEGEWWEMIDESSGLPYYYHTKTGETVWERPEAFIIPLNVLQNTALARRLSLTNRKSQVMDIDANGKPSYRRSRSFTNTRDADPQRQNGSTPQRRSQSSTRSSPGRASQLSPSNSSPPSTMRKQMRKSSSSEKSGQHNLSGSTSSHASPLAYQRGHPLSPIPGSPYATDTSPPPSPSTEQKKRLNGGTPRPPSSEKDKDSEHSRAGTPKRNGNTRSSSDSPILPRSRSSKSATFVPYRSPQPQSLVAALEMIAASSSQEDGDYKRSEYPPRSLGKLRISTDPFLATGRMRDEQHSTPVTPTGTKGKGKTKGGVPPSPGRLTPSSLNGSGRIERSASDPPLPVSFNGKEISAPIPNTEATANLSPVKNRNAGRPIPVMPMPSDIYKNAAPRRVSLSTGAYPVLPEDLASDILQFSESQFAKQYFSTHRTGFIFRRRVPVSQMMTWQKGPLSSPLLQVNKDLNKEATKTFRAIQRIMGDRERDRIPQSGSTTSLLSGTIPASILEEERWLLNQGLAHGELRDEIYCQVMKQLNGNPTTESVFRGWQLLCVLLVTFPPSKNFEGSLQSYLQQGTSQPEGRVDVMAKYCLRRLANISRKGPRGKAPTLPEIETASDAAFNPSIFGETLDVIFRLQERTYHHLKVPIILPFLADGILALGGTKSEGIFRVPGDGDAVSDLKLRIDKGYYTLEGCDDPTVLASLLKLWLRELCDPLVPEELYNDCITNSRDPDACIQIVHRLPTINRRVVLFVISFLQLFLDEKIQAVTKMTSANLALVMAPNLLRCNSDSMAVVFTNAQSVLILSCMCNDTDCVL